MSDRGLIAFAAVNRLDRLTSGLMILGLSSKRAAVLCDEFFKGSIKKEYIARCAGEFPEYAMPSRSLILLKLTRTV